MSDHGRRNTRGYHESSLANSSVQEEPSTMGEDSLDERLNEMEALINRHVSREQRRSRIPVMTNGWIYENWLKGREDADCLSLPCRVPAVLREQGSGNPVPCTERQTREERSLSQGTESNLPSNMPILVPRRQGQDCTALGIIASSDSSSFPSPPFCSNSEEDDVTGGNVSHLTESPRQGTPEGHGELQGTRNSDTEATVTEATVTEATVT
jgi:hypothetical protein